MRSIKVQRFKFYGTMNLIVEETLPSDVILLVD